MKRNGRGRAVVQAAAAFSLGAMVGSVIALLCAPASGAVTRRRLGLKVRNLQRTAIRRIGQTKRELEHKAKEVRTAATEWIAEHMPHSNGRHTLRRRTLRHAEAR